MSGDCFEEQAMVDAVEERGDVKIDNPVLIPAPLPRDRDRIQRRATRPVAVGVRMKHRLHLHRQPVRHDGLGYPVGHYWDTQPSELSRPAGLGNYAFTHRQRPERAVFDRRTQITQEPRNTKTLLQGGNGHAVHARSIRASITRDPSNRHDQGRRVMHEIEQVIEPVARISHRPTAQPGLHLRYPSEHIDRCTAIRRCIFRHCSILSLLGTAAALPR